MKEIFDPTFKQLKNLYLSKGIGVIMGEMGAVSKNNNSERIKYVNSLVSYCSKYNTVPVWWDSGFTAKSSSVDAFGLIDRKSCNWTHGDVASALVNKSKELKSSRPSSDSLAAGTTQPTTQATTQPTTQPTTSRTLKPITLPTLPSESTTQPTTPTTQKTYKKGDVSRDDLINSFDIMLFKKAILESK